MCQNNIMSFSASFNLILGCQSHCCVSGRMHRLNRINYCVGQSFIRLFGSNHYTGTIIYCLVPRPHTSRAHEEKGLVTLGKRLGPHAGICACIDIRDYVVSNIYGACQSDYSSSVVADCRNAIPPLLAVYI